jgi:cytochrome c553
MDEKTMQNLAAFYAAQQPQAPKVAKPMSTTEWAGRCDRCHGINGNSMDVRTPAIAAQRVDYLQKALRAYQKGERKESVMSAMTGTLSDADIDALALHYARQRARSVVYVPLPKE